MAAGPEDPGPRDIFAAFAGAIYAKNFGTLVAKFQVGMLDALAEENHELTPPERNAIVVETSEKLAGALVDLVKVITENADALSRAFVTVTNHLEQTKTP